MKRPARVKRTANLRFAAAMVLLLVAISRIWRKPSDHSIFPIFPPHWSKYPVGWTITDDLVSIVLFVIGSYAIFVWLKEEWRLDK